MSITLHPRPFMSAIVAGALTLAPLATHAAEPAAAAATTTLPAYQADLAQTSVSGLSSGAFMAAQFAVAYSSIVGGAGIVAGGPYYCAGAPAMGLYIPYLINAMTTCMNPAANNVAPPSAAASWKAATGFAQAGDIDPTANLKKQKVYLFSGSKDQTVTSAVVEQARAFYHLAGTPDSQLRYVGNIAAGHAFITDRNSDRACALTQAPYINDCDFSQARDILQHIYGPLNAPAAQPGGKLVAFNQRGFARSSYASMAATGYVYVPAACNSQGCRVHVVFHGCQQSALTIGDQFYGRTGYNEVADTNRIIVLYPQAEASQVFPYNPSGCWDFWGYTSQNPLAPDFYKKTAVQMAAVRAMLERLAAPRAR